MKIKNQIPPITHRMGNAWQQPQADEILVDDTHAIMSAKSFEKLLAYSHSMPSGAYEGKMWRCQIVPSAGPIFNYLRWYDFSEIGPGYVSNEQRIILICEQTP